MGRVVAATACVAATLGLAVATAAEVSATERGPVFGPLPAPVFDRPQIVAGTFGDHRSNHFHAGLDLATGVVGWAVHAPLGGEVRRVRASGVGYGRSIYIETPDGRLLVFGHLDAFAEPVASYVEQVQDSTGEYEQDLWPAPGRFTVRAGDVIAWSGRSGTGSPHLHVEVRRGDMALHPLRAGYAMRDTAAPRIERVTLVPLDDSSSVSGGSRPATFVFGNREIVPAIGWGRLRVVVEAVDMDGAGDWDIGAWRVRVTDGGAWVECRFDSVSWATDMTQSDFVYDRGRYTDRGNRSLLLAAPWGFRPRVIRASAPPPAEAGVLRLATPGASRDVTIEAEDLAGHVVRRTLRLTAMLPAAMGARPAATARAPARDAVVASAGASVTATAAGDAPQRRGTTRAHTVVTDPEAPDSLQLTRVGTLRLPAGALFEAGPVAFERLPPARGGGEATPAGATVLAGPVHTPLRAPVDVALAPAGSRVHVALYRDAGDGWEFVSDRYDPTAHRFVGSTRRLGRFALLRDNKAPRIVRVTPPRRAPPGPYPRWALEARLLDGGSGVDARASRFEVDGRRVPSEWDAEKSTLRWRPLRAPAAGTHRIVVVAADRSGNVRRSRGVVVLE